TDLDRLPGGISEVPVHELTGHRRHGPPRRFLESCRSETVQTDGLQIQPSPFGSEHRPPGDVDRLLAVHRFDLLFARVTVGETGGRHGVVRGLEIGDSGLGIEDWRTGNRRWRIEDGESRVLSSKT